MIAEELINHMIPPLKVTNDAHKAIVWMEEFRCDHLRVVEEGMLCGFISEGIILEANDIEKPLTAFDLTGKGCVVRFDTHVYDILRIASENRLQIVAVINDEDEYVGVIT